MVKGSTDLVLLASLLELDVNYYIGFSIEQIGFQDGYEKSFLKRVVPSRYPWVFGGVQACWTLSNIAAGTVEQIQTVLDSGALPSLVQLASSQPADPSGSMILSYSLFCLTYN